MDYLSLNEIKYAQRFKTETGKPTTRNQQQEEMSLEEVIRISYMKCLTYFSSHEPEITALEVAERWLNSPATLFYYPYFPNPGEVYFFFDHEITVQKTLNYRIPNLVSNTLPAEGQIKALNHCLNQLYSSMPPAEQIIAFAWADISSKPSLFQTNHPWLTPQLITQLIKHLQLQIQFNQTNRNVKKQGGIAQYA